MDVLHSFSIKNIFYDKMDLRFYFIFVWQIFDFLNDTREYLMQFPSFIETSRFLKILI